LGAAFLCAHLGVQGQLRHAEYLANWLALLREDSRAIFTAASKASQAADERIGALLLRHQAKLT
jgi:antirestriction protein ArdC